MKEGTLRLATSVNDLVEKLNLLREYLQSCALRSLHEAGAFQNLSVVGETVLRFLFQLSRFSEALYFSLENTKNYAPEAWFAKMKRDFTYLGFTTEITRNDRKTVNVARIKVAGLLKEAGQTTRPIKSWQSRSRLIPDHLKALSFKLVYSTATWFSLYDTMTFLP